MAAWAVHSAQAGVEWLLAEEAGPEDGLPHTESDAGELGLPHPSPSSDSPGSLASDCCYGHYHAHSHWIGNHADLPYAGQVARVGTLLPLVCCVLKNALRRNLFVTDLSKLCQS